MQRQRKAVLWAEEHVWHKHWLLSEKEGDNIHSADFYKKAIEKSFYIVDKEMKSVPFILNPPQQRMIKELMGMDIILKARQEGISSLILAMFTVDFLTIENIKCVVISHEDGATQRLFDRVKYFLESLKTTFPSQELPYKLKYNSRHELVNTEKNSTFYIGTAGSRAFGHGDTINDLHISELSRWPDQERMMVGLLQAVPKDGRIIVETTANGFGDYFYKMWVKAKEGSSPFRTHFIPWFELPEYVMPQIGEDDLTEEEQNLCNTYHLKREQIYWRRWKIDQMGGDWRSGQGLDTFNEQFPSNAEEAFIVSGNPVWSPTLLKFYLTHCRQPRLIGNLRGFDPVTVEQNEKGYLKVFKEPEEFHTYAIGVDVSEGKLISQTEEGKERDASCAQVLDKTTYEQVAVWYGRIDPDQLGRQVEMLGRYYNNALVAVERNAVGLTPLIVLRDLNYPNLYYRERIGLITEKITAELGWITDMQTKEQIISDTTMLLRDKRIGIYDEDTVGEMMSFVRDADGHASAAKSAYDDRVMAFMIAVRMLSKAKAMNRGNEIERTDEDMITERGFYMHGVSFNSQGMPSSPDEMDSVTADEF